MNVSATGARHPVAAVITDGPEAAAVARRAARIAADAGRPLLLVPMLRSAFTDDAVIGRHVHEEALQDARAVAARALPVLEASGVPFRVQVVWHRSCGLSGPRQARAIALAHAAHRAGAPVVVTPVQLPVPTVEHGPGVVLVAFGAAAPLAVHRPARSRRLDQL
ncbi:hypothetical protein [Kocuria sp. SM24M-10]|uniref:hypothetical protein n=1 Tax=Kocuria sp. SM24M-10 TaxID=1660349 RepID=UPI00064B266B|nr:hypothetical protein [Kocuria sp. SM24M-10]KLU09731.1 hypothetical protein ABL57_10705 [Kocuria sp. SM24M-10]